MDAVTLGACVLFFGTPANIPCVQPHEANIQKVSLDVWRPLIDEAAARFGMPQSWIEAVMRQESGGRTNLDGMPITSPVGAMGLMQLMPKTYAEMRKRLNLGADPYDPHDNILAGVGYLRAMYDRYGYPNLFAAYNAGPQRLDRALSGTDSLPKSTLDYINSLISSAGNALAPSENPTAQAPKSAPDPLFFVRADGENSPSAAVKSALHPNDLFVPFTQSARM